MEFDGDTEDLWKNEIDSKRIEKHEIILKKKKVKIFCKDKIAEGATCCGGKCEDKNKDNTIFSETKGGCCGGTGTGQCSTNKSKSKFNNQEELGVKLSEDNNNNEELMKENSDINLNKNNNIIPGRTGSLWKK